MRYISTRGETAALSFCDAVMVGQAPDGGLLVPAAIPDVSHRLADWSELSYPALAFQILRLYCDDIPSEVLSGLIERSYASFDSPEVTPLRPVGELRLLELFHGPTLAFKDVALQWLGNLFEHILAARGERLNILGATSGDTGSAGIAGVRGHRGIRIFVLFPEGRTSPVQERQMTTVLDPNVHCLAVAGSFDDCQGLMKSAFNDLPFKERYRLGSINSVNIARLLAQVVYYFYAYFRAGVPLGKAVSFVVPTGNFGDIFAGNIAYRMGLPVERLALATNDNDILKVFFETGVYRRGEVRHTLSPSMDIQVASNFERYLYYRLGEEPERLRAFMQAFSDDGSARIEPGDWAAPRERVSRVFIAGRADRRQTLETIARVYREHGYLLDPHTAVGVSVGRQLGLVDAGGPGRGTPCICLATAHPAKFPGAIEQAVGAPFAHHPAIDALAGLPSRVARLPARLDAVRGYIREACGDESLEAREHAG